MCLIAGENKTTYTAHQSPPTRVKKKTCIYPRGENAPLGGLFGSRICWEIKDEEWEWEAREDGLRRDEKMWNDKGKSLEAGNCEVNKNNNLLF